MRKRGLADITFKTLFWSLWCIKAVHKHSPFFHFCTIIKLKMAELHVRCHLRFILFSFSEYSWQTNATSQCISSYKYHVMERAIYRSSNDKCWLWGWQSHILYGLFYALLDCSLEANIRLHTTNRWGIIFVFTNTTIGCLCSYFSVIHCENLWLS